MICGRRRMAQAPDDWNARTERYFRAWSGQIKCREFEHLRAHRFYSRVNLGAGVVGALATLSSLFTDISALLTGSAGASDPVGASVCIDCSVGSSCFALRLTGILFVALVASVMAVFLFYKPATLAEKHKTSADRMNKMWRRMDLCLLQQTHSRRKRPARLLEDFERALSSAPALPLAVADARSGIRRSSSGDSLEDALTDSIKNLPLIADDSESVAAADAVIARIEADNMRRIGSSGGPEAAAVSAADARPATPLRRWLKRKLRASADDGDLE